jgi:hypothetical protein
VPFVNIWSGEMPEETWRLAHDVDLNMLGIAVPVGKRGVGEPDFTRQAPDRQRRCTVRQRCQICTGPGEWIVVSNSMSTKRIRYEGREVMVITEPWLCRPCADYALAICPSLIRRRRGDDLLLCRPTRFQIGFSSGWMEGPHEAVSQRELPAMWGELHVSEAVDTKGKRCMFTLSEVSS